MLTLTSFRSPISQVELQWWQTNRSLEVTSPWTNQTHDVYHYNVFLNTAPRPEVRRHWPVSLFAFGR